jgi:hypothetical protein
MYRPSLFHTHIHADLLFVPQAAARRVPVADNTGNPPAEVRHAVCRAQERRLALQPFFRRLRLLLARPSH